MSFPSRWRAPVAGAVTGIVVAAALVGTSALASGGGAPAPRTAAKIARASIECGAPPAGAEAKGPGGPSAGPGPGPFLAAIAQLVQAGTINDAQARVLDADIRAGSIDPNQVVANGTLSSAQVQTVMERLAAVKRSLAPESETSGDIKAARRK
jgi:hypothetical protein